MATKITALKLAVRFASGAYIAIARGQRVSTTHSAEEAARRLGEKLFGDGFKRVETLKPEPDDTHLVARFCLHGVEPNVLKAPTGTRVFGATTGVFRKSQGLAP